MIAQSIYSQTGTVSDPVNLGVLGDGEKVQTRNLTYDSYFNKYVAHFVFTTNGPATISISHRQPITNLSSAILLDYSTTSTIVNGYAYITSQLSAGEHSITSYFQNGSSGTITTKIQISLSNDIGIGTPSLTSQANYVLNRTYTDKLGSNYLDEIEYFDDLGRLEQRIQRRISPSKEDLVYLYEYDEFGRELTTWLPGLSPYNGAYLNPDTIKARSKSTAVNNDTHPYSKVVYENSPLNRVLNLYGPGRNWHTTSKGIKRNYKLNIIDDAILNCNRYTVNGTNNSPTLQRDGNYPSGQLYVTMTENEDSALSYEFKNKIGQTILIRQINEGINIDTYYVYNDYGNLCFVLPPRIQDEGITQNKLNELAYLYKYDTRNRCISKKLPGTDWTYFVYDMADRVIFTQNGEMRIKGEWLFTIPDVFGRCVLTGISKNNLLHESNPLNNVVVKAVWAGNTGIYKGYNVDGTGLTNPVRILTADYYDNYSFSLLTEFQSFSYDTPVSGCDDRYSAWKNGLLTGKYVADANNGTIGLFTAYYYNMDGKVVQTKSSNHLGGRDRTFIGYSYTGQPLKRVHEHTAPGKSTQTEEYVYSYDHAERLIQKTHKLNNANSVIIEKNSYDMLGRLITTIANNSNNLKKSYTYNVRSWIRTINNSLFEEELSYSFGGNVTNQQWRQAGSLRNYAFTYDKLSFLKSASFTGNGSFSATYTYDNHGNMTKITRNGNTGTSTYGIIDNLSLSYIGNQLTKVEDNGVIPNISTSDDFRNGSTASTEYYYDANGNMTKDLNKGISHIAYNFLNLPSLLTISNSLGSATNTYVYAADGRKLSVSKNDSITTFKTDYVDNVIYENGAFKRLLIDGGYYENGSYYFYIQDHLGNNRIVANQNGSVNQSTQYYPFGMAFADGINQSIQPYKYNGKELDGGRRLNWYDYSARYMDGALGRFTTVDPLAEKYYSISPYTYVANNPMRFVDPDGKDWKDFLLGLSHSAVSNASAGLAPTSTNNVNDASHYNLGRDIGDIASVIVGVGEFLSGASQVIGGGALTFSTGGTSSAISVPAIITGASTATHGGVVTVTAVQSFGKQEGRLSEANSSKGSEKSNVSSGNKNSPHANQKAKESAGEKYKEAKTQRDQLRSKPNKTPEDKKQLKRLENQVDHWKDKQDFPGQNHNQNAKGNR